MSSGRGAALLCNSNSLRRSGNSRRQPRVERETQEFIAARTKSVSQFTSTAPRSSRTDPPATVPRLRSAPHFLSDLARPVLRPVIRRPVKSPWVRRAPSAFHHSRRRTARGACLTGSSPVNHGFSGSERQFPRKFDQKFRYAPAHLNERRPIPGARSNNGRAPLAVGVMRRARRNAATGRLPRAWPKSTRGWGSTASTFDFHFVERAVTAAHSAPRSRDTLRRLRWILVTPRGGGGRRHPAARFFGLPSSSSSTNRSRRPGLRAKRTYPRAPKRPRRGATSRMARMASSFRESQVDASESSWVDHPTTGLPAGGPIGWHLLRPRRSRTGHRAAQSCRGCRQACAAAGHSRRSICACLFCPRRPRSRSAPCHSKVGGVDGLPECIEIGENAAQQPMRSHRLCNAGLLMYRARAERVVPTEQHCRIPQPRH